MWFSKERRIQRLMRELAGLQKRIQMLEKAEREYGSSYYTDRLIAAAERAGILMEKINQLKE